jgi:RNA polymerase sigma factor (sigma-70 family)
MHIERRIKMPAKETFRKFSPEEWELAKMGNLTIITEMVHNYRRVALKIVFNHKSIDKSEARSLAYYALFKAVTSKKYNPQKTEFTTYLVACVVNDIKKHLENKARERTFVVASLDDPILNTDNSAEKTTYGEIIADPYVNIEKQVIDKYTVVLIMYAIEKTKLKPKERICFVKHRLEKLTQKEIAPYIGHVSYVSKLSIRARKKILKKYKILQLMPLYLSKEETSALYEKHKLYI